MEFDDLFQYFGDIGPYQICVLLVIILPRISVGTFSIPFRVATMDHWCDIPSLVNLSYEQQKEIAIPLSSDGSYDSCRMYNLNFSSYSNEELVQWNRTAIYGDGTSITTIRCSAWIYDRSVFSETTVSAFDLVCDDAYLNYLVLSLQSTVTLIGAPIGGILSDRYGRKTMYIIGVVIKYLCGTVVSAMAPWFWLYMVGMIIVGIGDSIVLSGFLIVMEIIGPKYRGYGGILYTVTWGPGVAMSTVYAYFIRNFRYLHLVEMAALSVLAFGRFLPEPPRWLILKNKLKQAYTYLSKMCKMNRKKIPDNLQAMLVDIHTEEVRLKQKEDSVKFIHLFKTKKMTIRMLSMSTYWFAMSLMYGTIALHIQSLAGNLYVNGAVMGLIELPSSIIGMFLMNWKPLGRRYTLSVAMLCAAAAGFAHVPLLLSGYATGVQISSFIGRAMVSFSWCGMMVYTTEILPTEVRQVGYGTVFSFAKLGAIITPFMGPSMSSVWLPLPDLICGVVALIAGVFLLYLPETLNRTLKETIGREDHDNRFNADKEQEEIMLDEKSKI